jgi:hypothetical protein
MPGSPPAGSNKFITLDACDIVVNDTGLFPGDHIIEQNKSFDVSLTLKFDGILAPTLLCCLYWKVCYCFDICYVGHTAPTPHDQPHNHMRCSDWYHGRHDKLTYGRDHTKLTIPANTLTGDATYKITAIVKFYVKCHHGHNHDQGDHKTTPDHNERVKLLGAFADGPLIEILPA